MHSKIFPAAVVAHPELDRVVSLKETAAILDLSVATLRGSLPPDAAQN